MQAIRNALWGLAVMGLVGGLTSSLQAGGIQNLSLPGNVETSDWQTSSLTVGANSGFGGFPGTSNWPRPITPTTGDGGLVKLSNGPAGGPYPGGSSIYYGGFSDQINFNGGTLAAQDTTALANLANVVFQIQIGEAWGYDFFNSVLPVLSYNGGTQFLAATYSAITDQEHMGTVTMPTGDEDIFKNTYLLQWDLTGVTESITDISVQFTAVQHAQLYALRLDQSDVYESLAPVGPAVPEPTSVALLLCGVGAVAWRARRRSN